MSVKEIIEQAAQKIKETFTGDEESSVHTQSGSNPHAEADQSRPCVNKDEPRAFANAEEAGAKKPSEDVRGVPNPRQTPGPAQQGSSQSCTGDVHTRMGADPHAQFEQSAPFVNKAEPKAAANPCESGAKKPSEDVQGQPMPRREKEI
jgi:hypothetical protein